MPKGVPKKPLIARAGLRYTENRISPEAIVTSGSRSDKSLVGVGIIEEILETAFFTPVLTDSIPLSIMLVGPAGTAKSKLILQYDSPHFLKTNDVTSAGLCDIMERDNNNVMRHIIIPDFNVVVSHKSSTTNLTVATLLTLMSEGVARIDDGRKQKEIVHTPIGIITAMTRDVYEDSANQFRRLGLTRRFLSVFFTYSIQTRGKVQDSIVKENTTMKQLRAKKVQLPPLAKWPIRVEMNETDGKEISALSLRMIENLSYHPAWTRTENAAGEQTWKILAVKGQAPIEFTPHMILRTMAKAHALRTGRRIVRDVDVDFVIKIAEMTNYAQPILL